MKSTTLILHSTRLLSLRMLAAAACTLTLTALLSSCGSGDETEADPQGSATSSQNAPQGLDAVLVSTPPDGALSVVEARAQAQPGETVTLRGKVGGKIKPFSDAAAIFVLADEKAITSCDDVPGDSCPTPWDFCCEETATIAASTATIQVRDESGQLVRSSLRGLGGLKELSHLVITGTVDPASTEEALIVNADKIHVEKP